jgi:hypothetical protein
MKNLGKNGRNDFPLFPVPRISRSRGGTISGTTRKKPLCHKRSRWNARPQKKFPCFLLGCRSVPEYCLRGEGGTILENALSHHPLRAPSLRESGRSGFPRHGKEHAAYPNGYVLKVAGRGLR